MRWKDYTSKQPSTVSLVLRKLTDSCGTDASTYMVAMQGRNIPLDRMVEHTNNQIKEILHNQGANVTFESARKASASIKGVSDILGQLDRTLSICPQSGHSAQVIKDQDVAAVVDVLVKQKVFQSPPTRGRHQRSFPGQERDPAACVLGQ